MFSNLIIFFIPCPSFTVSPSARFCPPVLDIKPTDISVTTSSITAIFSSSGEFTGSCAAVVNFILEVFSKSFPK